MSYVLVILPCGDHQCIQHTASLAAILHYLTIQNVQLLRITLLHGTSYFPPAKLGEALFRAF